MYLGDMFMYLPICFCVKFGAYTIVRYSILYLHILQPLTNSASGRTLNFFGCWVRARAPQRCYLDGLRGARAREPKGEKKFKLVSRWPLAE